MEVSVTHFAILIHDSYVDKTVSLPDNADASMLLNALDIKESEVGFLIINSSDGVFKQKLRHGDRITIIPPLMGG